MDRTSLATIGTLGKVITGSTPPAARPEWFAAEGMPFLTPSDMGDANRFALTSRFLSSAGATALHQRVIPPGSVCFVSIGSTIGKMCTTTSASVTNQQINSLVVDEQIADPTYVYYAISQRAAEFRLLAGGSATPILNKSTFSALQVEVLPVHEQRAIGSFLDLMDDKIESNRRLASLLLKFIETEFDRRFGKRQLTVPLGDIADIVDCLHSKKPNRVPEGPTLMQLNNIRDDGLTDWGDLYSIHEGEYAAWSRRFETRPWDCVITNVGRIGAVARIPAGFVAALGRNMTGIRPREADCDGAFMAAALLSAPVRREIELRTDSGTVMDALNVRSIPHLRLPSTTRDERKDFQRIAEPLLERADHSLAETGSVLRTRDTLLPALLAGEIRVPANLAR